MLLKVAVVSNYRARADMKVYAEIGFLPFVSFGSNGKTVYTRMSRTVYLGIVGLVLLGILLLRTPIWAFGPPLIFGGIAMAFVGPVFFRSFVTRFSLDIDDSRVSIKDGGGNSRELNLTDVDEICVVQRTGSANIEMRLRTSKSCGDRVVLFTHVSRRYTNRAFRRLSDCITQAGPYEKVVVISDAQAIRFQERTPFKEN